jgi:hypothetical protein
LLGNIEIAMEKKRQSEIKALLQNMELVKETQLKSINNMTMVLSQLAPQYYTKEVLEKIEKIKQNLHKVEGEKVDNKTKYFSSDDCCTSYEERRVKSKIPKITY